MDDQAMRIPAVSLTLLLVLSGAVLSVSRAQETPAAATAPNAATAPAQTVPAAAPAATQAAETSGKTAATIDKTPLQQRPYRVTVEVGFSGSEAGDPQFRSEVVRQIRDGFQRMYGAMWNAAIRESNWFVPGTAEALERLEVSQLETRYTEKDAEKVLLIAVECNRHGFDVSCREHDVRIQELTPLISRSVFTADAVAHAACELGRDSFRPILLYTAQTLDKSELEFIVQAGMIIPPDPSAAQLREGDVLRTFLRQMDRKNPDKVKLLQRLDLCYVRITAFNQVLGAAGLPADEQAVQVEGIESAPSQGWQDSSRARGVLLSHGLVPFGTKGRNLQQIGVRQRPIADSSRVRLVLQNRPDRPLICLRVDQVAKLRQTDANATPPVRILTDRRGELILKTDPENPTFWLYAYSGSTLLARVPYAPGLIPMDTVKLPDDSIRLGVEGDLYLLRDELVDMAAEKAVHMSLAKKASEAKNGTGFLEAVAAMNELPGKETFGLKLNEIRAPAVDRAVQTKNSAAKRRIESLIGKMSDSLTKYFAPEKRVAEADELVKLRKAAGLPEEEPAGDSAPAPVRPPGSTP